LTNQQYRDILVGRQRRGSVSHNGPVTANGTANNSDGTASPFAVLFFAELSEAEVFCGKRTSLVGNLAEKQRGPPGQAKVTSP
jgi:hypothetical protein